MPIYNISTSVMLVRTYSRNTRSTNLKTGQCPFGSTRKTAFFFFRYGNKFLTIFKEYKLLLVKKRRNLCIFLFTVIIIVIIINNSNNNNQISSMIGINDFWRWFSFQMFCKNCTPPVVIKQFCKDNLANSLISLD